MDCSLQARLGQAIEKLQGLVGETAIIAGVTYRCVIGAESIQETLVAGGWESVATVAVSLRLQDVLAAPVQPALGDQIQLLPRDRTYRLNGLSPTQTTWELSLIPLNT